MEKLQPILQWLFKHRFWLTCGLVAIISVATWYTAWGKIEKERDQWTRSLKTSKSSIETVINSSVDISGDGKETVDAHPNAKTQTEMKKRNNVAAEAAMDAWKERHARQKEFLVFAPELPSHVVEVLKKHEPMEMPIPDGKELLKESYRDTFGEWILKRMPQLTKKIKTTWEFPRDPKTGELAKAGSVLSTTDENQGPDLVRWANVNQELWDNKTSQFKGFNGNASDIPTFEQCLPLQQDLWILGGIFDVIGKVNEGYTANDLAPVESIEYILVGADAVSSPMGKVDDVSVASSGGAGAFGAKKKRRRRKSSKTKKGNMFSAGASKSPFHGYYVNRDFSRLNINDVRAAITSKTLTDQSYLAVAKRIPVRIAVEIDERRINDFLAAAANSPFAFELHQVRINGALSPNAGFNRVPDANVGKTGKQNESAQSSLGFGGGGGDGVVTADGNDSSGGSGGRNGSGPVDIDGSIFRSQLRANFDVKVEFIGVVKVYNPPNRKLFFPDEKDAGQDVASK